MRRPAALALAGFLFALALALLPGCASRTGSAADVGVSLVDLRPSEASAFETRLAVIVRLTNQSPEPRAFSGSRHEVKINGKSVGVAVSAEPVTVGGLETVTQELTLNLSNFALLSLVRELQRNPVARYDIDSTLFTEGALNRARHTHRSGTLDLSPLAGTPVR